MLDLLLIRHGQTDWNVERRVMGQLPVGLNETGKKQVKTISDYLKNLSIDFLYYSPLLRTQESAEIFNGERSLGAEPAPALREIECGDWLGKTFKEIRSAPDYVEYYNYVDHKIGETGESLKEVQERGVEFIEELRGQKTSGRIALVSHADWIKCVALHYLKAPLTQITNLRIENASLTYLNFEKGTAKIVCVNVTPDPLRLFIPREGL